MKLTASVYIFIFAACLLWNPTSKADSPTIDCDFKTLTNFCESLRDKEKTQMRNQIPHKFSNGESMPSIDAITGNTLPTTESGLLKIPWGKMQRLQKYFLKTKEYAQEAILQGRTYDLLSEEEKNLVERIRTVKLSEFRTEEERKICQSNNGYAYSPQNHTLVMCPAMADYPSSAIIFSMAAFIGRGLGSCVTGNMKYVDGRKNLVWDRIPSEKHPFNKHLRACLIQGGFPDSQNELDFSKPELATLVNSEISQSFRSKNSELPMQTDNLSAALKSEKNLGWAKKRITDYRECLPEQTNSRVDSGIQDWFGAEVAARYLEDHPLNAQTAEDNLQPVASMVDYLCRAPDAAELTRKFHVANEIRFESAIFANERLRKVMNCSPKVPAKRTCSVGPPLESQRSHAPAKQPTGPKDSVK